MNRVWDFVKAFGGKTFEQNAKGTNDSIPKTEQCVRVDDAVKNNETIMMIDRNPPAEVALPTETIVIEKTVSEEKPKRKKKQTTTKRKKK